MIKKILYAIICFTVFASCLLPLTSCGAKASGIGVSASITKSEYVADGDYSTALVTIDVTNHNDGCALKACAVKLYFKNAFSQTVDTKTVTFTDIHVDSGERDSFYAVYNLEDGSGVIKGEVFSVDSEPYSMTIQKSSGGGSFWSIVGIVGAVIGIVFVAGVIWGVFFD